MLKNKYSSLLCGGLMLIVVVVIDIIDLAIARAYTFGVLEPSLLYEQYGNMGNFPGYPHFLYLPIIGMNLVAIIAIIFVYIVFKKQGLNRVTLSKEIIAVTCVRCVMVLFMLYIYWYTRVRKLDDFSLEATAVTLTDQYGFYIIYLRYVSYFIIAGLMVKDFISIRRTHSKQQ